MAEPLTTSAALLTSYFVLTGGTWKLFDKVDDLISKEAKDRAAEWLRGEGGPEGLTTRMSRIFSNAFDSVFGTKLFSFRMFWRSCLASLACFVLLWLIWAALRPGEFHDVLAPISSYVAKLSPQRAVITVGIMIVIVPLLTVIAVGTQNFITDYICLIKSRAFIALLTRSRSLRTKVAILTVDTCISAGLGLLTYVFIYHFLLKWGWDQTWTNFWTYVLPMKAIPVKAGSSGPMSGYFYATLFTSFWLWLTALGAFVLRLGQFMTSTRKLFTWLVRIDEKPFRAIGIAALGIETVVFAVLAVIVGVRSIWHA
jgi:hypothetical protein